MSSTLPQAREQSVSLLVGSNSIEDCDEVTHRRIERDDTSYLLFGFTSDFAANANLHGLGFEAAESSRGEDDKHKFANWVTSYERKLTRKPR